MISNGQWMNTSDSDFLCFRPVTLLKEEEEKNSGLLEVVVVLGSRREAYRHWQKSDDRCNGQMKSQYCVSKRARALVVSEEWGRARIL